MVKIAKIALINLENEVTLDALEMHVADLKSYNNNERAKYAQSVINKIKRALEKNENK